MTPPAVAKAAHRGRRKNIDLVERACAGCQAGRFEPALRHAEKALADEASASAEAYRWAAVALLGLERRAQAIEMVGRGLQRFPEAPNLLLMQGYFLSQDGRQLEARIVMEACLARAPELVPAWVSYSAILYAHTDFLAARNAAQRALELEPENIEGLLNYANALKELGDVAESVRVLMRISEIAPQTELHRSSLLFTMLFDTSVTALDLRREAQAYATLLARKRPARKRRGSLPVSGRIRLGLLSNDLYAHACAHFILPFLANLDRDRFEVTLFALNAHRDNVSGKFELFADRFVDLAGQSEAQIVDAIDATGLDILIDLGGYTGVTPVVYMNYGLAPIQMAWIGYPGTSGLPAIHYRISDGVSDPAGNEANYTEKLLRAPVIAATYAPLVNVPLNVYEPHYAVRQTPALEAGAVTFGCCINLAKISERTLRLWSAVLAQCPGSRLMVECNGLDKDEVRRLLLGRMEQAGIDPQRVICVPRARINQYVLYNSIDIVLDTAPMTGGANTCDALWMGVPVVTLAGRAFHERISAACVHAVGLGGLACESEDAYVATAVELAGDVPGLNALRLTLRSRFEQSALGDAASFCRWFEQQATALVAGYRDVPQVPARAGEGLFLGGAWYPLEQLVQLVMGHLDRAEHEALSNLLENISAKWNKHWLVAYALGEMAYARGERERALDLLIESAAQRKYSLPLYRLLSARLDECGRDKQVLDAFLRDSFGIDLAYLDRQGVPSRREIAGVAAEPQREAA